MKRKEIVTSLVIDHYISLYGGDIEIVRVRVSTNKGTELFIDGNDYKLGDTIEVSID